MTGTATYLYAITRPLPDGELAGLRGVVDAPVRAVGAGQLSGLASTVELAEFGEQALRTNLEDLRWLERTARQHDEVVRASAQVRTTVPLRLATICTDDAAAIRKLAELGPKAVGVLDELAGREEWGVKLFAVEPSGPTEAARVAESASASSSGAAYLRRRRQELDRRSEQVELDAHEAERLFRQLERTAVRAHRHRPQDQRLTGVSAPMLLNAAYLVERDRAEEFRRAVDELAGNRPPEAVVVTGPWPPYSFAAVDES
jgi:Gas vesicle synthesis protein GvpL/GvpF